MDERTETQRINDLEAWAFRAGRDLAEIKSELKSKSTVAAVDALHKDVTDLRDEVRQGFADVRGEVAGVKADVADVRGELAAQRHLLEQILSRLPA